MIEPEGGVEFAADLGPKDLAGRFADDEMHVATGIEQHLEQPDRIRRATRPGHREHDRGTRSTG